MYIAKTKTYTNLFSISELKEDLNIHSSDNSYDSQLNRLIKTAVSIAEKKISGDIVPTVNQLEDYWIYDITYQINEPNITITGITVSNNLIGTPVITTITNYRIQKGSSSTIIYFNNGIAGEKINISYTSGFTSIPEDIKRAIHIKVIELFDVDRSGYVSNNLKESLAFDRLLSPYMNLAC